MSCELFLDSEPELLIKRNKMLFGQKSEKGKYICDGQLSLDGIVLNEAEEQSDFNVSEPTSDTVIKKSKKTGKEEKTATTKEPANKQGNEAATTQANSSAEPATTMKAQEYHEIN